LSAPKAVCPPNREVRVKNAAAPDFPDSLRDLRFGPKAVVADVAVSPTGSVTAVRITESSGNLAVDAALLKAARESTYLPKIVSCKGVSGHFLFRVEFKSRLI
jgi:TonB family protein